MAVGRWTKSKQPELWIATDDVADAPAHPFCQRLNQILAEAEFDAADRGDTQTLPKTLDKAITNVEAVIMGSGLASPVEEVVADKGTHSGAVLVDLAAKDVRAVISEPNRGRRRWVDRNGELSDDKALEQRETYANRRRICSDRGRGLLRRRGEVLERAFAHLLACAGPDAPRCDRSRASEILGSMAAGRATRRPRPTSATGLVGRHRRIGWLG